VTEHRLVDDGPGDREARADTARLARLAEDLRELHHGEPLVLPNAWDAASAQVIADAGFPAVATASAAVSAVLGHPDGEGAPWQEMFAAAARMARSVTVPVTMDAEAGYGMTPRDLVDRLLECGVVGCNLEDTDHREGGLLEAEERAAWLAEVRAAADSSGVRLVVNARVDVFLPPSRVAEEDRVPEAVRRGRLYRDAGADCIYPIGVTSAETMATLVDALGCPVNGNTGPELELPRLRELGVARVSYGPRFYRTALADFDAAIRRL
jgi:2-methylisocitrate lyase-like PEP mutase family enzyme